MPELQFFQAVVFPRARKKLQNWVSYGFFSYLKFFSVSIIEKMTFVACLRPN